MEQSPDDGGGEPRTDADERRFRDLNGVLVRAVVTVGAELSRTSWRAVHEITVDGRTLWQIAVPRTKAIAPPSVAYERFEAEVRALCRLAQCYPVSFPPELPHLHGYNVDAKEPFLFLEPYRGRPAVEVVKHLGPSDKVAFQQSLLRALAYVDRATLVHGAIGLDRIYWDGAATQLVGFGESRFMNGPDRGDDLPATCALIRQVVIGPTVSSDMRGDPPVLRDTLRDAFAADPVQRPTPLQMLQRLHSPPIATPFVEPAEAFEAGRQEFDRVSAVKRGENQNTLPVAHVDVRREEQSARAAAPAVVPAPATSGRAMGRTKRRRWGSLFGLLLVIVTTVAATDGRGRP